MDSEFTSTARKSIDSTAWDDTITRFLGLREQFPTLHNLSLKLPYGLKKEDDMEWLWDRGDKNPKNLVYEPCIVTKDYFKNPVIFPMVLQHKIVKSGRKVVSIEQSFETVRLFRRTDQRGKRIRDKKEFLFDTTQQISKRNGYYYRWNTKGTVVRISKLIGTANINQIKLQGFSLVRECQRFIFLYCQG